MAGKIEIWDTLKDKEKEIIELLKNKDSMNFKEIIEFLGIRITADKKYHTADLKAISKYLRNLMGYEFISDNKENIVDLDEIFKITKLGKSTIPSDKEKLILEKNKIEERLKYREESIQEDKNRLKEIDSEIKKIKKGEN